MNHEPERWLAEFSASGYLVVEDCVDRATLKRLIQAVERITADPDCLPDNVKRHVEFEHDYTKKNPQYNDLPLERLGNALRSIGELPRLDQVFADFILYPPLLDVLLTLFGGAEFHFHNYKCIIKAPRVSSVFRWHRDMPYIRYSDPNQLTAMVCLDPMTEENGATVILPGTHRSAPEKVSAGDMDIPVSALPAVAPVTVTCPAGTAVIFHPSIIHGGGANRSDRPRRNIIGIWAGPGSYPINAERYAYQEIRPRTVDPARQRQLRLAFPHLFSGNSGAS